MRHYFKFISLTGLLLSSNSYAVAEFFVAPLYWRATETLDWVHTNNLDPSNLLIGFQAVKYNFDPGFRIGFDYEGEFDTRLDFTHFKTEGLDWANGNLTTGFLGGRLSQTIPATTFYQTGQAKFTINFNMIDWNIGKQMQVTNALMLRPIAGMEGGTIKQQFDTNFQSQPLSITERVNNDFSGLGPKIGIESRLLFLSMNHFNYSLVADLYTSYLWGKWHITDIEQTSSMGSVVVNVADRNFGALSIQGLIGASVNYNNLSIKLAYELSDWFNQCQIFDDETGTQNNDLILQGLTLNLAYKF